VTIVVWYRLRMRAEGTADFAAQIEDQ
jgi:hypothetical protein